MIFVYVYLFDQFLTGKFVEKTMMRKYGVENVNEHFISFNTICDATQVSPRIHVIIVLS